MKDDTSSLETLSKVGCRVPPAGSCRKPSLDEDEEEPVEVAFRPVKASHTPMMATA